MKDLMHALVGYASSLGDRSDGLPLRVRFVDRSITFLRRSDRLHGGSTDFGEAVHATILS